MIKIKLWFGHFTSNFVNEADGLRRGNTILLVHCNSTFKPYVTWFLFPNSSFYNRSIEFGFCPHCNKDIACLVEYRKVDDRQFVKYYKNKDVKKLREQNKHEIDYKSTDLILQKGKPYRWVYGLNQEKVNKATGEVTYKQTSCDFFGNKEVVKEF